jgi:hypothetical protein
MTTQSRPEGATHWSTRTLAAELGVSAASVSRDLRFVEKIEDMVGLYMAPPEHTLMLCCDE